EADRLRAQVSDLRANLAQKEEIVQKNLAELKKFQEIEENLTESHQLAACQKETIQSQSEQICRYEREIQSQSAKIREFEREFEAQAKFEEKSENSEAKNLLIQRIADLEERLRNAMSESGAGSEPGAAQVRLQNEVASLNSITVEDQLRTPFNG